ncbi:hypothetical protein ASG60_08665 [Methylobacterium sp. Leaf469]|uniref:hemin uptake protein HemP n=1 Tax=Methylobacterium sp. Leaf469 TaxID=1736387 RepID=UPI0006FB99E4|nr:hemin uptake protein HemP [Methylobacterium sp. Leaf469]KQT89753.1 hypothetical protein ASG60_08665 [Methylobacterium sp. Leaf469]
MSDVSAAGRGDPGASGRTEGQPGQPSLPEGGIPSAALLQGRREIVILHAGSLYRLRVTANDKLILTK